MPKKADRALTKKLSDEERHRRFLETAKEVEASENPKDFDAAFKKVVKP